MKNVALETFKSVKGLNPEYMSSLFSFSTTLYCTRCGSKLVQTKVNTISFGINNFAYQGFKIWNNLPHDVKYVNSSITCKYLIVRWQGRTCQCGFCIMCNLSKIHANDPCNALSQLIDITCRFSDEAVMLLVWD